MKRILNLPAFMLFAIAAMFLVSCEDEPGGGGGTDPIKPTVTLNSAGDVTLAPMEAFTIDFSASKGDVALKAVTIYEDGIKVPVSRLMVNGVAAAANPLLITGTDVDGLTWTATVIAHSTAPATVVYEVQVQDDNNLTNSVFTTVTTAATPPTLTGTEPTTIDGLEQGSKNGFKLTAMPGDGQLVSIEVRENDMLIDPTRIEWDGATMMNAENPFFLNGPEQDGFEEIRLFITLPMSEGTFIYTIIITDEFGLTAETVYTVTTAPSGTPIDLREDEVLNRAGSAPGGLDLDTGDNVASSSDLAEIVDNGIDTDQPVPNNWMQTISPVNGATMKYVVASANGIPEGFSFGAIETKEELSGLYTNNTGEIIDGDKSTSVVTVGDNFIVSANGNYWLLTVKEVIVTDDNNNDKYIFDVKY